jgi:3'-phosphoadenosine 5'-phosphosulfate (PAPS) 3'-phosphatase
MCDPVSVGLAIAGTAASMKYQSDQNDKQRREMKKQQEEARKQTAAEKNAQEKNTLSEASPLLIKQGGKSSKGLSQLKVAGSSSKGYNSLGMGGSNSTGLNIANG